MATDGERIADLEKDGVKLRTQFEGHEARCDERHARVEGRLDRIEAGQTGTNERLDKIAAGLTEIRKTQIARRRFFRWVAGLSIPPTLYGAWHFVPKIWGVIFVKVH